MSEATLEISAAYRNSRRNTSLLSGIGIAWSAAQFEIKTVSLGSLGGVKIEGASIPIVISIICIYSVVRCTIEYMMQTESVRRWPLAQLDYRITLYLTRFSIIALSASAIARASEMVFFIAGVALVAFLGFSILSLIMMFITMPIRLLINRLKGRVSVASAAIEATFYSYLIVGIAYIVAIILIGFNVIKPFEYVGIKYQGITDLQLAIFSFISMLILLSFFLDRKFLKMVFAFEPVMIQKSYIDENGKEIFSIEPNPAHPEYEKHKHKSPFKYSKVERRESEDISANPPNLKSSTEIKDENEKNV
jgi:hypothetical protein